MADRPMRIQRRRTKGWKMPAETEVVDRTTRFGNPFVVTEKVKPGTVFSGAAYGCVAVPTAEDAVECFRLWVFDQPEEIAAIQEWLAGKNLACWCRLCPRHAAGKPFGEECEDCAPCHADVLLEIANGLSCDSPASGERG